MIKYMSSEAAQEVVSGSAEKQIVQDFLVPVIKFPNRRIKATNPSQTCSIPDWIELRSPSL